MAKNPAQAAASKRWRERKRERDAAADRRRTAAGPDLTTANVEANLYASSGATLDLMESAWHSAFHKQRWTTARLGSVKSWITSTYDDSIQSLETDTKSRAFLRVIETTIAFIPA